MTFTDIQNGAEKAIIFGILGMTINSYFPLRQSAFRTAAMIAGVNCFLYYNTENKESLVALSIIAPIYLIHDAFFGAVGNNDYHE